MIPSNDDGGGGERSSFSSIDLRDTKLCVKTEINHHPQQKWRLAAPVQRWAKVSDWASALAIFKHASSITVIIMPDMIHLALSICYVSFRKSHSNHHDLWFIRELGWMCPTYLFIPKTKIKLLGVLVGIWDDNTTYVYRFGDAAS